MDVSLAPVVHTAGQYFLAIIYVLISIAGPVLATLAGKYLSIKLTDAQWAVFNRTAENWAKQLWAKEEASLATASVHVDDPRIASMAQCAINEIPDIQARLGLTPEKAEATMRQYILAHIGALQAVAAPNAVTK